MVLLGDEHARNELPGQLSLHFRLRGSWLVGNTVAERKEAFATLRNIYALRSQVAHNGSSHQLEKLEHAKRQSLVGKHTDIAEQVLRKLIVEGFPLDWSAFVLGGSLQTTRNATLRAKRVQKIPNKLA
jgi:hypothetical protein